MGGRDPQSWPSPERHLILWPPVRVRNRGSPQILHAVASWTQEGREVLCHSWSSARPGGARWPDAQLTTALHTHPHGHRRCCPAQSRHSNTQLPVHRHISHTWPHTHTHTCVVMCLHSCTPSNSATLTRTPCAPLATSMYIISAQRRSQPWHHIHTTVPRTQSHSSYSDICIAAKPHMHTATVSRVAAPGLCLHLLGCQLGSSITWHHHIQFFIADEELEGWQLAASPSGPGDASGQGPAP